MSTTPNLDDLHKLFTPLELTSPVTGKTYALPFVDYQMGLQLRVYQEQVNEVIRITQENLKAAQEAEEAGLEPPEKKPVPDYEWPEDEGPTPENMLGEDLLEEMQTNGEPYVLVQLATQTAWFDFLHGREFAEEFWASGGDTKKATAKITGRASAAITSISTNTDEANTTQKPGSTSGT